MDPNTEVLLHDVVLDLVQILEEASESGRLVGGDVTTLEDVAWVGANKDAIILTLSNGEKAELRIRFV